MTIDFKAASVDLYTRYACKIRFREWLCGGTPKNPDLIGAWVKARTGHDDELTKAQTEEALAVMTDQVAEKTWIGFPSDDAGLFVWARQVKAMFRESATMLRVTTQKIGSKQILQHGFEIKAPETGGDRIYLGTKKPTGTDESPIHVQTAQGPRTALRRMDYVTGAELAFEVWVLTTAPQEKRHVGEEELVKMLAHAQENGLGASRSQGYGKFDVTHFASM